MHLVYLTFGKTLSIHSQAAFSICSFLAFSDELSSINVVTDSPEYYAHLKEKVNIIALDSATISDWKGKDDVFFRTKIKAIEMICSKYPNEPILYADTDTFVYDKIDSITSALAQGKAVMHEKEGMLIKKDGKTERKMWERIKGKTLAGLLMKQEDLMWNAGIVAFPNNKDKAECRLALQLCDEISSLGIKRKRLIEQYSFSIALNETYGLNPAASCVAHYWGNKAGWNVLINDFFLSQFFFAKSLSETASAFRNINLKQLPIKQKEKNTANKLHKFVDNLFPIKDKQYL